MNPVIGLKLKPRFRSAEFSTCIWQPWAFFDNGHLRTKEKTWNLTSLEKETPSQNLFFKNPAATRVSMEVIVTIVSKLVYKLLMGLTNLLMGDIMK